MHIKELFEGQLTWYISIKDEHADVVTHRGYLLDGLRDKLKRKHGITAIYGPASAELCYKLAGRYNQTGRLPI